MAAQRTAKGYNKLAKVYTMGEDEQWVDRGMGYVKLEWDESNDCVSLVVESDQEEKEVLRHMIVAQDIYDKQQSGLITWTDPVSGEDFALSFHDGRCCKEVLENICYVQQAMLSHTEGKSVESDEMGEIELFFGEEPSVVEPIELPNPNVSTIEEIHATIADAIRPRSKKQIAAFILNDCSYLDKLLDLYEVCEDTEDKALLEYMFNIFKNLILLNSTDLLMVLFSEEYFMKIMRPLQYDPEVPSHARIAHHEYLESVVEFKEFVPIEIEGVKSLIHQTFRLKYLKDTVLPRALDDLTFQSIHKFILYNNAEIITKLYKDDSFLPNFRNRIRQIGNDEERRDAASLLRDLCDLAKHIPIESQSEFYSRLSSLDFMSLFPDFLKSFDEKVVLPIIECIQMMLVLSATQLRQYMMRETPPFSLLVRIVDRFLSCSDSGHMDQFGDIIRLMLDVDTMVEWEPRDDFLQFFYSSLCGKLLQPIKEFTDQHQQLEASDETNSNQKAQSKQAVDGAASPSPHLLCRICDLLSFFVTHHGYRAKYFLFENKAISTVLELMKCDIAYLSLAALRFFRNVVGKSNDFFETHIIQHDMFDPVVGVLCGMGDRYNLLNSAIIDLFEYVNNSQSTLANYIVARHRDKLQDITYVPTFSELILKFDQRHECRPATQEEDLTVAYDDESYFERDDTPTELDYDLQNDNPTASLSFEVDKDEDIGASLPPLSKKSEDDDDDAFVAAKVVPMRNKKLKKKGVARGPQLTIQIPSFKLKEFVSASDETSLERASPALERATNEDQAELGNVDAVENQSITQLSPEEAIKQEENRGNGQEEGRLNAEEKGREDKEEEEGNSETVNDGRKRDRDGEGERAAVRQHSGHGDELDEEGDERSKRRRVIA